jgi:hypothetical protein
MRERSALRAGALALAGYLILSIALLGRTWLGGGLGHRLVGGGGDPLGFVWFLAWLPHALAHGQSPFFSTALMAPQGANLLSATDVALPSLLLWPITGTLGAVASYDVLATLAPALSAWVAFLALRRITPHRATAFLGGLLYGFGGYMTGQATAHVNLMLVVFPPLAAMLIDDIGRRARPVRSGLLLGVCAAAQVFVDEEILATTAIVAALALAFAAWRTRPARETVLTYVRALAAAALVLAVVAGPALAYQMFGPQHVSGAIVSSGRYVNDLEGFFVPNADQWLSTAGSRRLTAGFSGFDGELGSYLGVPLIALLLLAAWRLRRRALPAGLLALCAALFSLGPHLRVGGRDTGIYLPWIVPNHLPLLENAVPDRFNLFVWLAVAVLVALLIDELRARPLLGSRALSVAVCAIPLLTIVPNLSPSELVRAPPAISSAAGFRRALSGTGTGTGPGSHPGARTVLIAPVSDGQLAMYAQVQADFAYRIPDGGVFVPSPQGASYGLRHGPLLYALAALGDHPSTLAGRTATDALCLGQIARATTLSGACRSHYLHALRLLDVYAVIATDLGSPVERGHDTWFFESLLGAGRETEGATVYIVPGA